MNIKYIFLSILLIFLSCNSPKKTVINTSETPEIKKETPVKVPKVETTELLVVLKNSKNINDVKELITNSGLTWEKLVFDQKATKIGLIKVPAEKSNFWMERLLQSGEFKTVELNKNVTLNKIISEIENNLVSLRKTMCYGHCPVFEVKISNDGNVFYNGIKFVLVKGKREFKLTDTQFAKLKEKLSKTTFSNYKNSYNNPRITDLPSTYISNNQKEIQIRVWREVPTELVAVSEYIEDILLEKKFYEL